MDKPFEQHFGGIEDPRTGNATLHLLSDIIGLSVIALLCRVESWEQIEMFGKAKLAFLRKVLRLPHGIPSHDTLERVFRRINPAYLEDCFRSWAVELRGEASDSAIALDGKSLRGTKGGTGSGRMLHLVSAWATDSGFTLAQEPVNGKENEQKAMLRLIEALDLCGCTLTVDAMGNQKSITTKIIESKTDYVSALKENQATILEETWVLFESIGPESTHTEYDKGHGRIERRSCGVIYKVDMLDPIHRWPGLQALVKVEAERIIGEKTTTETRYYLSSRSDGAETLNRLGRGLWAIENTQHWVLDVTFEEDRCRKRKDNAGKNFAPLRRIAPNILKQDKTQRMSIPKKRLKAAIDEGYLEQLIAYI